MSDTPPGQIGNESLPRATEAEQPVPLPCDGSVDSRSSTAHLLPTALPGHWDTPGGRIMASTYVGKTRQQLIKGDISDLAVANAVFMAGRNDLDLIVWQTAAKERIRWLSAQLAIAGRHIEP